MEKWQTEEVVLCFSYCLNLGVINLANRKELDKMKKLVIELTHCYLREI